MGSSFLGSRRTWVEICSSREYRNRWVALDAVRYDELTARPVEGTVVDSDDDLANLCSRVRHTNRRCCAILFCDEHEAQTAAPPRPVRHRAAVNH